MAATSMKLHQVIAMATFALVCTLSPALGAEDTSSSRLTDSGLPSAPRSRSLAEAGCKWPFNNGTLTFQFCTTLDDMYTFGWNVSTDMTSASVTVGFSHMSDGWIGWGISETGKMVGSNAIIGYQSGGNAMVADYYLGGKSPTAVVTPSKFASVSNLKGEYVSGEIRTLATVQLSLLQVASAKLIWALGPYSEGIEKHTMHDGTSVNLLTGLVNLANTTALAPTLGVATAPSPAKSPPSAAIPNNRPFFTSSLTALLLLAFALI
eukprot:TRINITY_DN14136_c0_g1_i1.p1 TRINITY_DN14136_c0_g1~~TRINITY_DN14136_c0_g1_i1.p1  ORF type:complete len:264 (-),score=44.45 TRINITY_DN14136_c0_g1_i1:246-1037(-)